MTWNVNSFKMENRMPGMNTTWAPQGPWQLLGHVTFRTAEILYQKSQLDKWSWLWRLGLVKWFPSDLYNIKRWCEENVCIAKGLLWNCGLNESIKHTRYSLHVPKCTTGGHKIINTCRREVGGGKGGLMFLDKHRLSLKNQQSHLI